MREYERKDKIYRIIHVSCDVIACLLLIYLAVEFLLLKNDQMNYPWLILLLPIIAPLGIWSRWMFVKRNRDKHMLYHPNRRKFLRNKFIMFVAIVITIVVVGYGYGYLLHR